MISIYLIGSLRNPKIPKFGNELRASGFDVFDDWMAAGPEADDYWQKYEQQRGHTFDQALKGYAAQHVYHFDLTHLNRCDIGVLMLPAGKSGHLELGYMIGKGKPGFIFADKAPERFDVMYNFASGVFFDQAKLIRVLKEV
jgi:nucleoside 2-deoxyribosyltransferase